MVVEPNTAETARQLEQYPLAVEHLRKAMELGEAEEGRQRLQQAIPVLEQVKAKHIWRLEMAKQALKG